MRWLTALLNDENGPTAVEYAVMLALILAVVFVAIIQVGTQTKQMMDPNQQLSGTLGSGS